MGTSPQKSDKAGILTPVFQLSFPQLFMPKKFGEGEAKYSVVMLFQKDADLTKLRAAAKAAAVERFGEKLPANFKTPFRDGKEKAHLDGYGDGVIFVRATSTIAPEILDQMKREISSQRDIYAGCYCRAVVAPFAYDNKSKGVSFGLRAIQKVKDGKSFGAGGSKADFFDEVEDETDGETAGSSSGSEKDPFDA